MSDRTVHAQHAGGRVRLVRYDRAGKWRVEDDFLGESAVTLDQAVRLAWNMLDLGGKVFFGLPGGRAFDRRVRQRPLNPSQGGTA